MAAPATCSECERFLAPVGEILGVCVAKTKHPWQATWYAVVDGQQLPPEACPDKKKKPPGQ
jgi:hypothetical protein